MQFFTLSLRFHLQSRAARAVSRQVWVAGRVGGGGGGGCGSKAICLDKQLPQALWAWAMASI